MRLLVLATAVALLPCAAVAQTAVEKIKSLVGGKPAEVGVAWIAMNWDEAYTHLFAHSDLPMWLIALGTTGQIVFTLRFVYQWIVSRRRGESLLPMGFWLISLTGSAIIITYALLRGGMYPLILGHITGVVVYSRNVMIAIRHRKASAEK